MTHICASQIKSSKTITFLQLKTFAEGKQIKKKKKKKNKTQDSQDNVTIVITLVTNN